MVHLRIKYFACTGCKYKCYRNVELRKHIIICTGGQKLSAGEFKVMQTLDEMNIEYKHETVYELKNDKDKWLRWDFVIQTDGGPMFIEYDGRQHFKPVRFGGMSQEKAEEAFKKGKANDKLKDDYCTENNYSVLRIPYTQFGNIQQLITAFICENTEWDG
jgi:hypothetical protein